MAEYPRTEKHEDNEGELKISRRNFLKKLFQAALTGLILPTPKSPFLLSKIFDQLEQDATPRKNSLKSEKKPKDQEPFQGYNWQEIGPPIEVSQNSPSDGIRAVGASEQLIVAGTWTNGIWVLKNPINNLNNEKQWERLTEISPDKIARHILMINQEQAALYDQGIRAIIITDNNLYQLIEENNKYRIIKLSIEPGIIDLLQTGLLIENDNSANLLLGGMGGIINIPLTEQENPESIQSPEIVLDKTQSPNNRVKLFIRCLAKSSNDEIIVAGGWWGYSGKQKDHEGKILPGSGVWISHDHGENWEQVLRDVNINSVFVHPHNPNIIIAGTEGAGNEIGRTPNEEYPSLYISFDQGANWEVLLPQPWTYDLVAPQQGIIYDEKSDQIIISFWAGPVISLNLSPTLSRENYKDNLRWKLLTPDNNLSIHSNGPGGHLAIINGVLVTGSKDYSILQGKVSKLKVHSLMPEKQKPPGRHSTFLPKILSPES